MKTLFRVVYYQCHHEFETAIQIWNCNLRSLINEVQLSRFVAWWKPAPQYPRIRLIADPVRHIRPRTGTSFIR